MADAVSSDEEKYANESFENETTDNEIPEISESESYSESEQSEPEPAKSNPLYAYTRNRFSGRSKFQKKDFVPYDSSSDDDNDVVISETVAEINTEPMLELDDLMTPKPENTKRGDITVRAEKREKAERTQANDFGHMTQQPAKEYKSDAENVNPENSEADEVESEATEAEESYDEDNSSRSANEAEEMLRKTIAESKELQQEIETIKTYDPEEQADALEKIKSYVSDILLTSNMLQAPMDHEKLAEVHELDSEQQLIPINGGGDELNAPAAEKSLKELTNRRDYEEDFSTAAEDEMESVIGTDTDAEANNGDTGSECYDHPKIEFRISSHTPTSLNSDEYAFHMNFVRKSASSDEQFNKLKPLPRKSWSFSNSQMREIERQNHILLKKILTQKPTYTLDETKNKSKKKFAALPPTTRVTSAAVNRKKQQRQIDLDNQVLKRKIEAISLRKFANSH